MSVGARRSAATWVALGFLAAAGYLLGVVAPQELAEPDAGFGDFRSWDLDTYFIPKFALGSQEIVAGRPPLWNRYEFGGIPLLATAQPAAAYPPKILIFAAFEPVTALRVFLVAHLLLAGFAFLAFVRHEGIGGLGMLAGVASFAFSRNLLVSHSHPVVLSNLAWVPLVFLCCERLGRAPSVARVAALSLVVGMLLTAGYPQVGLDCAFLAAVLAVARYLTGDWAAPPWRTVPWLAAGFLGGACVAAIQLLPLVELVALTGRLAMAREVAARVDLPLSLDLLTIFANGVPGLLALAAAGLGARSRTPISGFLVCAALLLGAWQLLRLLPGFGAARLPGTWSSLTPFFVAWLVACGTDRLVRTDDGWSAPRRGLLAVLGVSWLCISLAVIVQPALLESRLGDWLGLQAPPRALAVAGLGALGGAAFVVAAALGRGARPWLLAAVVLVVAGHLTAFPFGRSLGSLGAWRSPHRIRALAPEAELGGGRVLSLHDLRNGSHILEQVESPFGREGSLPPPRFTELERRLGVVPQMMQMDWKALAGRRGLLDTLDLRHVVVPRSSVRELRALGFEPTGGASGSLVPMRARDPLGRAFAVHGARIVGSPEAALAALLDPAFDARQQAILEAPARGRYPERATRPPTPARVRSDSSLETTLEIDLKVAGILIVSNACFPGWTAEVDGRRVDLQCVNYLVQGVELDAGHHRVRLRYEPGSFRWGLVLSGLALTGFLAALLFGRGPSLLRADPTHGA